MYLCILQLWILRHILSSHSRFMLMSLPLTALPRFQVANQYCWNILHCTGCSPFFSNIYLSPPSESESRESRAQCLSLEKAKCRVGGQDLCSCSTRPNKCSSPCQSLLGGHLIGQVSDECHNSANVCAGAQDNGQDGHEESLAWCCAGTMVVTLGRCLVGLLGQVKCSNP